MEEKDTQQKGLEREVLSVILRIRKDTILPHFNAFNDRNLGNYSSFKAQSICVMVMAASWKNQEWLRNSMYQEIQNIKTF